MRPRAELATGAVLLLVLGVGAAALGSRRARLTDSDPRRSTYLAGPQGASGFAEAVSRLGVTVVRQRRQVAALDSLGGGRTLVAFLGPSRELSALEGVALARAQVDLLLAGLGAAPAIRCLGYDVVRRRRDSVSARRPDGGTEGRMPWVQAVLFHRLSPVAVDSSDLVDGRPVACTAPAALRVDTLLRDSRNRAVAIRLTLARDRIVTLVAEDHLFANRALRETAAGPFALRLVVPRYARVVIDEFHHGYDASGSLAGATVAWTRRSPWGWAIWQLAVVGVLALVAAGVRFGPVRSAIERRRRSPLEHVRALATALAAASGHDVAVRLIVQGLRRRLSHAGRSIRGEATAWLEGLGPAVRTSRGRGALETLTTIIGRPASADDVLAAANAVETLWEELKPS
jgi:uncharacterized membrane protein YidH (DUF202 family)